jgi:hypothetical protein
MDHQVRLRRGPIGLGESHPKGRGELGSARVHVDQLHPAARNAAREPGDETAQGPGAHHGDPVADLGPCVPEPVDGRLQVGGQDRTARRDGLWNWMQSLGRHPITGLVWIETEAVAPHQPRWPFLHHPDAAIAVLDRSGKVATLEGRPHALVFARRHLAAEHQGLGPSADAAVAGVDQGVARVQRAGRALAGAPPDAGAASQ